MGWTDKAVRRYVRDAGDLLDELNHLQRCDCTTRNQNRARALQRRMDELERRIAELREQEELDAIRPPLDGRQVMDHLGVKPGPRRGRGARLPARGAPRRGPDRRGRRLRASRRAGPANAGIEPAAAGSRRRATEIRRLPCGRATRSSSGTRAPGVSRAGLEDGVDPEPGAAELGEHLADAAGVDACRLDRRARRRSGPARSTSARPRRRRRCRAPSGARSENTNGPFGFSTRCTCRNSRADVVDLGDRVGAERDVDRLGPEEGEVGEVTRAPLDLHLFALGALRGRGRAARRSRRAR